MTRRAETFPTYCGQPANVRAAAASGQPWPYDPQSWDADTRRHRMDWNARLHHLVAQLRAGWRPRPIIHVPATCKYPRCLRYAETTDGMCLVHDAVELSASANMWANRYREQRTKSHQLMALLVGTILVSMASTLWYVLADTV